MHFAVADGEVVVHDREERREVGNRLVLRHVVIDAQAAADIDEAEREAQLFEVLDDDVHLVAHVLEHMQLADLRTDMQVDAYNPDVFERFDLLGMLKHLFI